MCVCVRIGSFSWQLHTERSFVHTARPLVRERLELASDTKNARGACIQKAKVRGCCSLPRLLPSAETIEIVGRGPRASIIRARPCPLRASAEQITAANESARQRLTNFHSYLRFRPNICGTLAVAFLSACCKAN
jgi:hypothetical protein